LARLTRKVQNIRIWLPSDDTNVYSIAKISGNDISDYIISMETVRPTLKFGLARATFMLTNPDRYFIGRYSAGAIATIYSDYTDGSTLKFTGKIETPRFGIENGYKCRIFARQTPLLTDKKVNYSVEGIPADEAIIVLTNTHYPDTITLTNISNEMKGLVYGNYDEKSWLEIAKDILQQVEFDGYIDSSNDLHTFAKTGSGTSDEHISEGVNLLAMPGYFGGDSKDERNRVKSYGKVVNSIPILWTSSDTESQSRTWIKDEVVKATNLDTIAELKAHTEGILAGRKDEKEKCRITTIGLKTTLPGQNIPLAIPGCGVNGNYFISEMTDNWSATGSPFWSTNIQINENEATLADLFVQNRKQIDGLRDLDNPNNIESTVILLRFVQEEELTKIEALTDCNLSYQKLMLDTGQTVGTMISNNYINDSKFSQAEIRVEVNDDCNSCEFYASNDNGESYVKQTLDQIGELITFSGPNKIARLKIKLISDANNPKPEIISAGLFIKT